MPRIPNVADRKLYAFSPAATWPTLAPFIGGRIDEALIVAQWDDVLRLATSVRTGAVSASLMLKRLGAYARAQEHPSAGGGNPQSSPHTREEMRKATLTQSSGS